jgi:hypothetical protein
MKPILALVCMLVLVSGCVQSQESDYCAVDSDCVPAQCCHPKSCVNINHSPNCTGIYCSLECAPGTLDCGQGRCECIGNKCEAVID